LKILPNAVSQIFCLADIDDFAIGVFVNIDAGLDGQVFEFFL
jgi:hypothetical protein